MQPTQSCTAFAGTKRIASGELSDVALKAKAVLDQGKWTHVLIFDDVTSELIEVDFRGTAKDVVRRIGGKAAPAQHSDPEEPKGPGRPKLGVIAREVTLLPRHWEWLASQPGGASVALRKLVEHARLANQGRDRQRRAQEATYRFLSAMAGNEPGYEEALRALFANNREVFHQMVKPWPVDIRNHAKRLAAAAFERTE
jgi:hypothetical protein